MPYGSLGIHRDPLTSCRQGELWIAHAATRGDRHTLAPDLLGRCEKTQGEFPMPGAGATWKKR
jgi:hypothetical protein